jgi:hypothetical protein
MATSSPTDTKVPASARWLGALGLVPFIGLAGAEFLSSGTSRAIAAHALVAYGATILAFLGGVHWGLAIGSPEHLDSRKLHDRLILSVLPSLIGWAALLFNNTVGLLILAAGIAAMLLVDIRATQAGHAPLWYPKLRIPLTCIVVSTLLLATLV